VPICGNDANGSDLFSLLIQQSRFVIVDSKNRKSNHQWINIANFSMIDQDCLDKIIRRIQMANLSSASTLKYASLALCNLSIYTCAAGKKKLIARKVGRQK